MFYKDNNCNFACNLIKNKLVAKIVIFLLLTLHDELHTNLPQYSVINFIVYDNIPYIAYCWNLYIC